MNIQDLIEFGKDLEDENTDEIVLSDIAPDLIISDKYKEIKGLKEAKGIAADIRKFLTNEEDYSWENFKNNYNSNNHTMGQFKTAMSGYSKETSMAKNTTDKNTSISKTASYGERDTTDDSSWSSGLKDLHSKYSNLDVRSADGSATAAFNRIEDICYDIAAGTAAIRHAIIYGDAGTGKCTARNTLHNVQCQDDIYDKIVHWQKSAIK